MTSYDNAFLLGITGFQRSDRVQTHPATDAWMQGDRFGNVTKVGKKYVEVHMDRSARCRRFLPADLTLIERS